VPWYGNKKKSIIHCANIILYLGSAIALPMIGSSWGTSLFDVLSQLNLVLKLSFF
jgi:hypothetical protein